MQVTAVSTNVLHFSNLWIRHPPNWWYMHAYNYQERELIWTDVEEKKTGLTNLGKLSSPAIYNYAV